MCKTSLVTRVFLEFMYQDVNEYAADWRGDIDDLEEGAVPAVIDPSRLVINACFKCRDHDDEGRKVYTNENTKKCYTDEDLSSCEDLRMEFPREANGCSRCYESEGNLEFWMKLSSVDIDSRKWYDREDKNMNNYFECVECQKDYNLEGDGRCHF